MVDISPVTGKPFPFDDDDAVAEPADPAHLNGKHHAMADQLRPGTPSESAFAAVLRTNMTRLLREVCAQMNDAAEAGLTADFQIGKDGGGQFATHSIRIAREY
jgi:hypothetical protein